ncbi:MAG: NfeD family protein [Coraliomargarita sp.]|nr:NfeD family protein [Coraliomargarita sp.]
MAVDLLMVKAGYSHFSKREREAMEWREKQEAENKAVIEERSRKIESVFGANAVVVVDLKPLGEIDINGNRVTARSELGIIERGEEVLVSSHNGLEYIVRLRDAT